MIIGCFVLSFVGLVYPIIPSVLLVWVGIGLYHFGVNSHELSWISWTMMVILTIFLLLADYLASRHFVDSAGGSVWGMRAAAIGVLAGSFVIPPFGVILVPFILVFAAEMSQKKNVGESVKVAFATLLAFLSSTLAKVIIQFIMIVVFVMDVIF